MIHRCFSFRQAIAPRTSDLAEVRLCMQRQAPTAEMRINGIQMIPASGSCKDPAAKMVMAIGTSNWATAAPRFPPAAFSPKAQPFWAAG